MTREKSNVVDKEWAYIVSIVRRVRASVYQVELFWRSFFLKKTRTVDFVHEAKWWSESFIW